MVKENKKLNNGKSTKIQSKLIFVMQKRKKKLKYE